MNNVLAIDSDGRRSRDDRRQFFYSFHIPEKRSGIDRRSGVDRRSESSYHRGDKERRQIVQ